MATAAPWLMPSRSKRSSPAASTTLSRSSTKASKLSGAFQSRQAVAALVVAPHASGSLASAWIQWRHSGLTKSCFEMVEPVGGLDQRRAGAGDRIGEGGAVAGGAEADVLLERRAARARPAAAGIAGVAARRWRECRRRRGGGWRARAAAPASSSRPAARAGGPGLRWRLGSWGSRSTQARTWGSSWSGGEVAARPARRRPRSSQPWTSSADGDPPGVEIVAIGQVEIARGSRRRRGAAATRAPRREAAARSLLAASRRSTKSMCDAPAGRAPRFRGRRRSPRRARRAACSGSSAARPWDRRGFPRTNGTAGRGGRAAVAAR